MTMHLKWRRIVLALSGLSGDDACLRLSQVGFEWFGQTVVQWSMNGVNSE